MRRRFSLVAALIIMGVVIYCAVWIVRYQSRVAAEPEIVLVPDVADIVYCTMEGVPLMMDLYYPDASDSPSQVLVYVHGGSFTSGDKREGSGIIDIPAMTARGYTVAAINYRLMPAHPFPAAVTDVKCAIRFLRAHAEDYQLRVVQIGIWGGSAGGHLAAMVGLTNDDSTFEVGEYLEQSSQVDGVVEMFGPTDLTLSMGWMQQWLLRRAFGTDSADTQLLHDASPVYYVTAEAPPFLILHGEQDSAVPVEHATVLHEALLDAGVDTTLVAVENANHNFKPTGGEISPTRAEISALIGDFFDRVLD